MNILISGDFNFSMLGASYERAFKNLGHNVTRFDIVAENHFLKWQAKNRYIHRATIHNFYLRNLWSKEFNKRLIQISMQSNIEWLFLLNGTWIMPETIIALKNYGKKVAIFHADNPFPPNYNNRPETLTAAVHSDLYLIWSKKLVLELKNIGVKNAEFLPFGWDKNIHPYQNNEDQGSWAGAVFVGGWDREREDFLEEISAHVPIKIHGPAYWGTRSRPNSRVRKNWTGAALRSSAAALEVRKSAITLNILRTQHMVGGQPDAVIMRNFEVPGSGGFLLSTRNETAMEIFEEGVSAAYFSDYKECIDKCRYYLNRPAERLKIVEESHQLVSENYTYEKCAEKILMHMKNI